MKKLTKKSVKQAERTEHATRELSIEELAQVSGGITASMPPLYYGDATYGDMRLIPKTPLVCG